MPNAPAVLDYEQRLRVLGELAAFPPGEQLLARLVILEGVALSRALSARVADVDLTGGRLTLADKHSRARVVELDIGTTELAAARSGGAPRTSHSSSATRDARCGRSVSDARSSPPRGAPGCPGSRRSFAPRCSSRPEAT
jgi:hypothetical protein